MSDNKQRMSGYSFYGEEDMVNFSDYDNEETPELLGNSTTTSPENPMFNEEGEYEEDIHKTHHHHHHRHHRSWSKKGNRSLQDLESSIYSSDGKSYMLMSDAFKNSQRSFLDSDYSASMTSEKKKSVFGGLKRQFKKMYLPKAKNENNNSQEITKQLISNPVCIEGRPSLTSSGNSQKFRLIKETTLQTSETPSYNQFAKYRDNEEATYTKPREGSTAESFEQLTTRIFENLNVISF
ncbi:hypothetical protein BY458DRAFT_552299 [Sporodiniella umbellata]|nr:hypothetical protein BY458DRAFT_552299 [Sporodiniella umbellata]